MDPGKLSPSLATSGLRLRAKRLSIVCMAATIILLSGCALFGGSVNHSGKILFGFGFHRVSSHQIDIRKPRTTFFPGQTVAWVAYLKHPARSRTLTMTILSARTRHPVFGPRAIPNVNPKFTVLANSVRFQALTEWHISAPGKYTLRYYRGSHLLAEGTFQLRG